MPDRLEPLRIGDLEMPLPIVQGGMGVQVSTASLAGAVAACGAAGTIAGVGLGYGTADNETDFVGASRRALIAEIRKAKAMTKGVVGVNLLGALSNFEDLARTAAAEGADFIASGAGLPLCLPALTEGFKTRLVPIVSSARAAAIIIRAWKKRYDRIPDGFIVEGPLAGGHLGFKPEELKPPAPGRLEADVAEVLAVARDCERETGARLPVIAAGGIFDGKDAARFFAMGARGVQIATRLVATLECSAAQAFKDLYLRARPEDLVIIESPVGMPGRAIRTRLVDRVLAGDRVPFKCGYQCLRTCNPATAPYCIAQAMFNAVAGDIDNAVVFAGHNVSRVKEIVPVRELLEGFVAETLAALPAAA